jgi:hypothetical protein
MKKIILVKVPTDSTDYFINNVGCLRYSHNEGRESTAIEPMTIGEYLDNKHKIIGESFLDGQKLVIIEENKEERTMEKLIESYKKFDEKQTKQSNRDSYEGGFDSSLWL